MPVVRNLSKYKNVLLGKNNQQLLLGLVKRRNAEDEAVEVECSKMSLDETLLEYFMYSIKLWAHDPQAKGELGDTVLIQLLPEPMSPLITHSLMKVVQKQGKVYDRITSKQVSGVKFTEDILNENFMKSLKLKTTQDT